MTASFGALDAVHAAKKVAAAKRLARHVTDRAKQGCRSSIDLDDMLLVVSHQRQVAVEQSVWLSPTAANFEELSAGPVLLEDDRACGWQLEPTHVGSARGYLVGDVIPIS